MNNIRQENAVAAIRVSSIKQGLQGDSPEAQKEQIERFAQAHNINIKKFFIFMESASKEEQPVQEAIDYCKNPKNNIDLFIIKSIDRFTRGGSYLYDHLKMQLVHYRVKLIDIYGIIGTQDVNTLEHLGVQYDWSVYSPTKKSEILEAERAKDEMRDIMSRMIGAEIRYVRLGYRVRRAPFGYKNESAETPHGRRIILKPHPEESQWILKMYEMRLRGTMKDPEIVEELNKLGFRSRIEYKRDPHDRTRVLGQKGGKKLINRQFQKYIQNPIYAGINIEKWTNGEPIKGNYEGLVSIETFNQANKGKIIISEENGKITLSKEKPAEWRLKKVLKNPKFPFRRYVLCPECRKPLYGSASRGKSGKLFPVYHCDKKNGHSRFSVPVKTFDQTIKNFVKNLRITKEGVDKLKELVLEEWKKRMSSEQKDTQGLQSKIQELEAQKKLIADKIMFLTTPEAIKMIEDKLKEVSSEITRLQELTQEKKKEDINMELVMDVVGYFLEHLELLLLQSPNRVKSAAYFGLMFTQPPTYQEITSCTPKLADCIVLIKRLQESQGLYARPEGIEPPTLTLEPSCSIR